MTDKNFSVVVVATVIVYILLPAVVAWSISTIMGQEFELTIRSYLAGLVLVIILF